ncbi:hypothetical protein [Marinobacterium aestuariivivens]|uniref:Uncharacterized protein n=1 Tax=Marinobacterium aestuariivivens TaxID=1698799 RepID=A0ABW1ZWV8_9GAMM
MKTILVFYVKYGCFLYRLERAYWMFLFIFLVFPVLGFSTVFTMPDEDDLKQDLFYVDRLNFSPKKGQRYGIYGYSLVESRRLYYRGIPRPDILEDILSNRDVEDRKILVLYYHSTLLDKMVDRRSVLTFIYNGEEVENIKKKLNNLRDRTRNVVYFSVFLVVVVTIFWVFPFVLYISLRRAGYVK